jgi:hypothetical protein
MNICVRAGLSKKEEKIIIIIVSLIYLPLPIAIVTYIMTPNRGVTSPLLWKILFFLVNQIEKTVFSGVFWCRIYTNEGVAPPLLPEFEVLGGYASPVWETSVRP